MGKVCSCGVQVLSIDISVEDELDLDPDGITESSKGMYDGGGFFGTAYVFCPECKRGFFDDPKTGEPNYEIDQIVMDMEGAHNPIPGIEVVVRRKEK